MKDSNSEDKDRLIEALRRLLSKTEEVQSKIKADNAAIELNIRKLAPISSEEGQNFEIFSKKNQEKLEKFRIDIERLRESFNENFNISKDLLERRIAEKRDNLERLQNIQDIERRGFIEKINLWELSRKANASYWDNAFEELKKYNEQNRKKTAQVKVYLTEAEKKILEDLAKEQNSDNSSVMRELLRTKGNPNLTTPINESLSDVIGNASEFELKVLEPKTFNDIKAYVEYLDNGEALIINLEALNKSDENMIQRSIDFISGATYKLGSDIVFVGKESILVTTKKSNLIVKKDLTKGDKKEI